MQAQLIPVPNVWADTHVTHCWSAPPPVIVFVDTHALIPAMYVQIEEIPIPWTLHKLAAKRLMHKLPAATAYHVHTTCQLLAHVLVLVATLPKMTHVARNKKTSCEVVLR